jgi:hypothetical protein
MGKTTRLQVYADGANVSLWEKPSNKWWNGYNGEECVFVDDPPPKWSDEFWGYLKVWLNLKRFTGETKGSEMKIRFQKFVVCANCPPEEYFGTCAGWTAGAFDTRFKTIEIKSKCDNCPDGQEAVEQVYESFF